jgi:hypothetical protein
LAQVALVLPGQRLEQMVPTLYFLQLHQLLVDVEVVLLLEEITHQIVVAQAVVQLLM